MLMAWSSRWFYIIQPSSCRQSFLYSYLPTNLICILYLIFWVLHNAKGDTISLLNVLFMVIDNIL